MPWLEGSVCASQAAFDPPRGSPPAPPWQPPCSACGRSTTAPSSPWSSPTSTTSCGSTRSPVRPGGGGGGGGSQAGRRQDSPREGASCPAGIAAASREKKGGALLGSRGGAGSSSRDPSRPFNSPGLPFRAPFLSFPPAEGWGRGGACRGNGPHPGPGRAWHANPRGEPFWRDGRGGGL